MGEEALVNRGLSQDRIDAGSRFLRRLDTSGLPVTGCFWFYVTEKDRWRLFVVSRKFKQEGPRKAYQELQSTLQSKADYIAALSLSDISVIPEADVLVSTIAPAWEAANGVSPVIISGELINGRLIDGAYIYRLRTLPAKSRKVGTTPSRPSALVDTRVIYCGDNLEQLAKLPPACVDLIYIDPPFNSNRNYEVFWGETKEKRAFEDRHSSTQAYIDYMRPRCQQLHRVLKKTGSFYYHCDWHASHYVKVMLDQIFGENQFQSEIVWKRTHAHGSADRWAPIHDSIFFYSNGKHHTWTHPKISHAPDYVEKHFRHLDEKGRKFQPITLTGSGVRNGDSGKPWRGVDPTKVNRHWAIPGEVFARYRLSGETVQDKLDALDRESLVYWPKGDDPTPRLKWYADELGGMAMGTVWSDIAPLSATAKERLGYPTQKPLALLERIINASSNPNDIVLDAFCGCGTALVAAQNLGRQWIGIDISPTACRVMAKRLRDVCNLPQSETLWKKDSRRAFALRYLPWTIAKLKALPPFEFENWAVIALGGTPNVAQVGDMGIDGRIYPVGTKPAGKAGSEGMFGEDWFPIQVKQMEKVGRPDIDQFEAVMEREDRPRGFFVAFGFSADAEHECVGFHRRTGRLIKLITVQEILDEQFVQKM